MKDFLMGFVVAFSMYSKIPMPRLEWTSRNMKYCMCFFPLIGLVIGALDIAWYQLAVYLGFGQIFRTAVLILIPVIVTGGIHLDGLLDTADALSSYKPMEEKLLILKDSHAGAFAIIVGIFYFVLSFGVFSEVTLQKLYVIGAGFVLSRAFSGLGLVSLKKAKNTGLLAAFSDAAANQKVAAVMIGYLFLTGLSMILLAPPEGTVAVLL
ncbi:MAG: adenosylcobinamide-GDP ribazoletransferase, partial [Lachnospiraceae bacterium]|nr:adenosylcobinamide-GDP ribazoletransferase [Lachnospiraceae bacterium]